MESALYGIYALVVFVSKNLTRSLRSLVRFLIRQQLVRKYRTPALSIKYSLLKLLEDRSEIFMLFKMHIKHNLFQFF